MSKLLYRNIKSLKVRCNEWCYNMVSNNKIHKREKVYYIYAEKKRGDISQPLELGKV